MRPGCGSSRHEPIDWQGKTNYDFWPRETADLFHASDKLCLAPQ